MKILLILIVAAGIYTALNWEMVSSKLGDGIDDAIEFKEKGDELSETVRDKFDDAKDKLNDAQEKMDKARDSLDALIEKSK